MLKVTHSEVKGAQYIIRYDPGIDVTIGRVTRDYSKSPQAEIIIDVAQGLAPEREPRVFRGRLGLLSRSGIKGAVDTLKRRVPSEPWDDLIDDVCDRALNNQRTRMRPKIVGLKEPERERPAYQVWPLLPSRQPTIIYGQGGIGKSWLAVYLCALVDNGITVNGLNADVGKFPLCGLGDRSRHHRSAGMGCEARRAPDRRRMGPEVPGGPGSANRLDRHPGGLRSGGEV